MLLKYVHFHLRRVYSDSQNDCRESISGNHFENRYKSEEPVPLMPLPDRLSSSVDLPRDTQAPRKGVAIFRADITCAKTGNQVSSRTIPL